MKKLLIVTVLLALFAWGLSPFLGYAGAVPLQPDSILWIENARSELEGWADWTFRSSHFVGYRPLTALSFTMNLEAFGPSAAALRLTDLALHGASALGVALLAWRLLGAASGALAATVALIWFLGHPGTDEVVPFLARRSYPIAVACAMAGFLAAAFAVGGSAAGGAAGGGRSASRWLAGLAVGPLLAAALFGNELGALVALALPAIVHASAAERPWRRTLAVTAWGWAWVAAGVWVRQGVLDGDSGYEVLAPEPGRGLVVLRLYGAALVGELGVLSGALAVGAGVIALYYGAVSAALARCRASLLPLALVCVLAAYGAVASAQSVWFPRQVYPATALVALFVGCVAALTLGGPGSSGPKVLGLPRWLHAVPQAALLGLLLVHSPLVHGTSSVRAERAAVATGYADHLSADLGGVELPAEVLVVAPVPGQPDPAASSDRAALRATEGKPAIKRTALRVPLRWLRLVHSSPELTLRDVLYVTDPDSTHGPTRTQGDPPSLLLPQGVSCFGVPRRQPVELPPGQTLFPLPQRRRTDARGYLWIYGAPVRLAPL